MPIYGIHFECPWNGNIIRDTAEMLVTLWQSLALWRACVYTITQPTLHALTMLFPEQRAGAFPLFPVDAAWTSTRRKHIGPATLELVMVRFGGALVVVLVSKILFA